MERRALIAMLLMLLVLMLYLVIVPQPQRPSRPSPAGETKVAGPVGDTVQTARAGQAGQFPGGADTSVAGAVPGIAPSELVGIIAAPPREILVSTPLYTAKFSTAGGVLASLTLDRYLSASGQPVELVPKAERLPLGVALLTKGGDRIDLSGAAFEASAETLRVQVGDDARLAFTLRTEGGLTLIKTCEFDPATYAIGVTLEVEGPSIDMFRAIEVGWQSGLNATEANRSDDLRNFAAVTLNEQGIAKNDLGRVNKNKELSVGGRIAWSGVRSKYFFAGVVPVSPMESLARNFMGTAQSIGMALELGPVLPQPMRLLVYAGPLDYYGLKHLGHGLEKAVDFGWKWIGPLSRLIFAAMVVCYKAIPNYGVVIILFSTLTKLLFHPLTAKSYKSMREMQKIQPEIAALREKHKKDPQALNKAIMTLYRTRGVSPMGGCLPLLLQMPVFISLFNVLSKTIELRGAGFMLWIRDLSAPDVVARLPFSLPFIGDGLSVLPILMGIAMFVQQKMSTTDPKQAMMTYLLPVVFTVMFFRFPSGLVLYWLINNILTIAHQYWMIKAEAEQAQGNGPATGG